MLPFATEFPVKRHDNKAAFVAEVLGWLRGMERSTVLAEAKSQEFESENAYLKSSGGEEFRIRELRSESDWQAIGFRHDAPDDEGRVWRTEGVLKRAAASQEHDLVRIRTQCLARVQGAHLETPHKPYLIKSLLNSGWGGADGLIPVSDQAVWLEGEDGIATAWAVISGEATKWLPVIYFSSKGKEAWSLTRREIEKLAYDLGGIAHVVVEPDRAFSYRLRDESKGQNPYGGSVGIAVPGRGIVRKYYIGWHIQNGREMRGQLKRVATYLRGQMPSLGWDWAEIQEQALRAQRERDKARLSDKENIQILEEEIENLNDRILDLQRSIDANVVESTVNGEVEFSRENIVQMIGPEIYDGEISDRLRLAAQICLQVSDNVGLDSRSIAVFKRILNRMPLSLGLEELSQDISRAAKDPRRLAGEMKDLLSRHGYRSKSENKHIRLEARDGYEGLESITISKTPSEIRGLKNFCSQVEKKLGINKMS